MVIEIEATHREEHPVKSCGSCEYFQALNTVCRFNPPSMFAVGNGAVGCGWPQVKTHDLCGQYKAHLPVIS